MWNALLDHFEDRSYIYKTLAGLLVVLFILAIIFSWYWSRTPDAFDVRNTSRALTSDGKPVIGSATTGTLILVAETLLEKPGGYLHNDVTPPSVFLDNMPNWEFGVLVQIRDLSKSLRNDMSRSQTQSIEDEHLATAEPQFNVDASSWVIPQAEGEYRKGIRQLQLYLDELTDQKQDNTQFYARADNLEAWLSVVEKRMGSLSQRLSASVGQDRINTDLGGDADARQSTSSASQMKVKTPWLEIDDVFYEARGSAWALLHFLKAVELDFAKVLEKKNATVSLRQIIRELEATQQPMWSPVILNGTGFGIFANHSLVMASYISRANAAIIDLRTLLRQG